VTREAGFTLTETLLAVALLALIAAAATPVLRGGIEAQARITSQAAERSGHAALERVVRDTLAAAVDAPGAGFSGSREALSFTARPDGAARLLAIQIRRGPADGIVVTATPQAGGARSEEILDPGTPFAGFYFYGRPGQGRLGWYDSWPGPNPPRLVVLDLEPGADGSVRRIEARVGAEAGLACDYDSGLQACREGI
jgi:prepilin-type N-terminal cleavage/methylation domain-containing protein